jgi:uncharacterized protein
MVAKMVAKKAVPVVVIIQPNLLVLIVALLAAMAVKKVAVMVVRILLSLLVQDVVIVALVPALLPVPMIVQKVAWILAVVHVFQPVWDSARVLVCLDVKRDAGVGAGVTIDTNVEVCIRYLLKMKGIKKKEVDWKSGMAKNITFIVTKDCQLACKYCYLVGKNSKERMPWEVAKQAIDYVLEREEDFPEESVVWDFIGGEPFLEIDLIDKICDYIKVEQFQRDHHWFGAYRFSFSTNGINYHEEKVQQFILKNKEHLSIGITIDGTEMKHDLNRVYKASGRGSYKDVVRNIPLWLSQFPDASTKVTISSADIPYIKESVLHLYALGIHEVNINCVFEDVWKAGDDRLFEEQLLMLADAIIDNGYYRDYSCSFFGEHLGKPLDCKLQNQNWCGAGMMLAVDAMGNFYPCTRFAQYSLCNKKAWIIGNIHDGIDKNKLRPFLTLDRCTQSTQECIDCEVASGCAWCQGENYDAADTSTIYQRSTAICKMHKARVRANNYYWNRLLRKMESEGEPC